MHTLTITSDLPKKAKAAYATLNGIIEQVNTDRGLLLSEVRIAWSLIRRPEHIWARVEMAHSQWVGIQSSEARDILYQMALLWQCGVRDTTDTLSSEVEVFLDRLAIVRETHVNLSTLLTSDIGLAKLGWKLYTYFTQVVSEEWEMPSPPKGKPRWEAYITGTVAAVRLCKNGQVVANAERIRDYLKDNCLPPSVFGIDDMQLTNWLAASALESTRFEREISAA